MVPEFGKKAFEAKPNAVTDVVKTEFGFHIILVKDRKAAGTTSFEKAKTKIKDFLVKDKQITALDEIATAAKKKAKIEFMDDKYNNVLYIFDIFIKEISKKIEFNE